jgi:hypothetical protein
LRSRSAQSWGLLANGTSVNGHHPALANAVHAAASNAFFHGFSAACLVAAGVSAVAGDRHPAAAPRPSRNTADPRPRTRVTIVTVLVTDSDAA